MVSRLRAPKAVAITWLFSACSDPGSSDRLTVELASLNPIVVRFDCATQCPKSTVALTIDYPGAAYNPADTLQLLQYRVDYDLDDVGVQVPYYAEPLSLVVKPNEMQDVMLLAAGDAQRARLARELDATSAIGDARLQLAGFDWDNRHVFIDLDFKVQFRRAQGTDDEIDE